MKKEGHGFLGLTDDATSSDVIEQFSIEYMLSLLQQRARHGIDGLSKVLRRIIYVVHAVNKKKKVYNHTGMVMDYHPSGDSSISDAMTSLMQPWVNAIPLLDNQGGIGSYSGSRAAASRYLEGMVSQFTRDVFITPSFNKTLTMIPVSGEKLYEPEYFIPKIPTAFIMGSNVTAKGFRTKSPQYNFNDVCELVKYLSEHILEKQTDLTDEHLDEMAKYLIPDPPSHAHLRNRRQLLAGIKERRFDIPLAFDGHLDISRSSVIVKSIPPGYSFVKNVDDKLKDLIRDKKSWLWPIQENYNDETDQRSSVMWAKARIELKRSADVFEHLHSFKSAVGFSQNNVYNYKWLYRGQLRVLNPIEMLTLWAKERMSNIGSEYTHSIKTKIEENRRLKALIKIQGHTKEVIRIIEDSEDTVDANKALANKFEISVYQASAITAMRTGQLTKRSKAVLMEDEKQSVRSIKELNNAFKQIPERMFQEADQLQNKYSGRAGRRTSFSNFSMYVQIFNRTSTGFIQLYSMDELKKKFVDFKGVPMNIGSFSKGRDYKYILVDGSVITEVKKDLPKESTGVLVTSPNKLMYTVKLSDGTICYLNKLYAIENGTLVSDKVLLVTRKGTLTETATTSLPLRKSAKAVGNMTDVKHVANVPGKQYYVVYVDPKEKNVIRATMVTTPQGSIKQVSVRTKILAVNKMTQPLMVTLPSDVINRLSTNHIYISDMRPRFDKSAHIVIDVKKLKKKRSLLIG